MKCPSYRFENPKIRKFCLECGEKLELKCPSCGKVLLTEVKFCNECSEKLALPSDPLPKDLALFLCLRLWSILSWQTIIYVQG